MGASQDIKSFVFIIGQPICQQPTLRDDNLLQVNMKSEYHYGEVMKFSCNPGLGISTEYSQISCEETKDIGERIVADWDNPPPVCLVK